MKVTFHEHNEVFSMDFEAETLEEAGWLTRFGLFSAKVPPFFRMYAKQKGIFSGYISFKKKLDSYGAINRTRG